jgi:hypothetical protein
MSIFSNLHVSHEMGLPLVSASLTLPQPLNQAMSDDVLGDVLGTMYTRYGEAMGTTRGMPKPQAKALLEQTAHQVNKELAQQYGYVYYRENIVTGETDGYGT